MQITVASFYARGKKGIRDANLRKDFQNFCTDVIQPGNFPVFHQGDDRRYLEECGKRNIRALKPAS